MKSEHNQTHADKEMSEINNDGDLTDLLGEGISPLTDHVLRVQAQSRMQIQHMKAVRNCLLQL